MVRGNSGSSTASDWWPATAPSMLIVSSDKARRSVAVVYFRCLRDPLFITHENEIVDDVPEPFATLLELGNRAFPGWAVLVWAAGVAVAWSRAHHIHHVLGIGYPVGGHVDTATPLELVTDLLHEVGLDKTTLVVPFLVPGIREKYLQRIQRLVGDAVGENFLGIVIVDPQVAQVVSGNLMQQSAYAGAMDLYADEIAVGVGHGHLQQGIPHAETDLHDQRCAAAKSSDGVHDAGAVLQSVVTPEVMQGVSLGGGQPAASDHVAAYRAALLRSRCIRLVEVDGGVRCRIYRGHGPVASLFRKKCHRQATTHWRRAGVACDRPDRPRGRSPLPSSWPMPSAPADGPRRSPCSSTRRDSPAPWR